MLGDENSSSVWNCEDYQIWKKSNLNVLTALLQIWCAQEDVNGNDSR